MRKFILLFTRITLLLIIVFVGFTAIFPEWLDFKDQLIADAQEEKRQNMASEPRLVVVENGPHSIRLTGGIDSGFSYRVKVFYEATQELDKEKCTTYQPFTTKRIPLAEWRTYRPTIVNNQHSIEIPLDAVNPNASCVFLANKIVLGIHTHEQKDSLHYDTLFARLPDRIVNAINFRSVNDTKNINLQCAPAIRDGKAWDNWTCRQGNYYDGFYPAQYLTKAINTNWTVNIHVLDHKSHLETVVNARKIIITEQSLKLIANWLYQYMVITEEIPPKAIPAQALISNQFFQHLNDKDKFKSLYWQVKNDLRRIETKNNIPVDLWGNVFYYRSPARHSNSLFEVYSLGPDGIESEDDIWSNEEGRSSVNKQERLNSVY